MHGYSTAFLLIQVQFANLIDIKNCYKNFASNHLTILILNYTRLLCLQLLRRNTNFVWEGDKRGTKETQLLLHFQVMNYFVYRSSISSLEEA